MQFTELCAISIIMFFNYINTNVSADVTTVLIFHIISQTSVQFCRFNLDLNSFGGLFAFIDTKLSFKTDTIPALLIDHISVFFFSFESYTCNK